MTRKTSNRSAERTRKDRWGLYHIYYKRTGFYNFLTKTLTKLGIVVGIFLALYFVVDSVVDIDSFFHRLIDQTPQSLVLLLFAISETVLGLIPPDFFILWAKAHAQPYFMVGVLALLSYLGGIGAYGIGVWLASWPKVKEFVTERYVKEMAMVRKWGGFFIVLAALFPLPFAVVSTLVGIIRFDFKLFLLFGLFRFLRFFLYALVLFQL